MLIFYNTFSVNSAISNALLLQEGTVSLWNNKLKLQKVTKLTSELCRVRDLWVTSIVPMTEVNKVAVSFTSKDIGQ